MKTRSPLLKETKLVTTPKHIFSNTRSLLKLQPYKQASKSKRRSEERNPPVKPQKSLNTTHDFLTANRYLSDINKCNTTPTQRSEVSPTALQFLITKLTEKENQKENRQDDHRTNKVIHQNEIINQILSKQYQTATASPAAQIHHCDNHPSKKAKYIIQLTNTYLCSKCSIEKASLGQKVIELDAPGPSPRKATYQKKHSSAATCSIQQPKIKTISLSNYNVPPVFLESQSLQVPEEDIGKRERKECIDRFKLNICSVLNEKPLWVSQFDKIFGLMIEELNNVRSCMKKELEKMENCDEMRESLVKMQQDIVENEANIVEHMAMEPFNEIMGIYDSKIFNIIEEMKKKQDGVIKQFERLSLSLVIDVEKKLRELIDFKSSENEIYVSFQNREVFEDALKASRSKWNVREKDSMNMEQNFVQACETDLNDQDQIGKFEDILFRVNQSQSQQFFQQFGRGNYQRTLFDSESPHFKD